MAVRFNRVRRGLQRWVLWAVAGMFAVGCAGSNSGSPPSGADTAGVDVASGAADGAMSTTDGGRGGAGDIGRAGDAGTQDAGGHAADAAHSGDADAHAPSDDGATAGGDTGGDVAGPSSCSSPPPWDPGELPPVPASAHWIDESEDLPGGIAAEAEPGDIVLTNGLVWFVVHGPDPSDEYITDGMLLIDADLPREPGEAGADFIKDYSPLFGLRVMAPETIDIVSDGQDGGAAIVEVHGTDGPLELIAALLPGMATLTGPPRLDVTMRYILAPGEHSLLLETTVTNTSDEFVDNAFGDAFLLSHHAARLAALPGGFVQEQLGGERRMAGAMGTSNQLALAVFGEHGEPIEVTMPGFNDTLFLMTASTHATLQPGESVTYRRRLAVGRDLEALEEARREAAGNGASPWASLEGVVQGTDGEPVAGARVYALDANDDVLEGLAVTGPDGHYALTLEPGTYRLVASARSSRGFVDLPPGVPEGQFAVADGYWRSDPEPVEATACEVTTHDLTIDGQGVVHIEVVDTNGDPVPAMVTVQWAQGTQPVPPDGVLGLGYPTGGAVTVGWTVDGTMDLPVPPGTWDILVSRGFEWSVERVDDVTVEPGKPLVYVFELKHEVDPHGWRTIDTHMHAAPSNHGDASKVDRVVVNVANGLDVFLATDHDHAEDYNPEIELLGATDLLYCIPSDEVSTALWGHFNPFPLTLLPAEPNNGAPLWWKGMHVPDVDAYVRDVLGAQFIQVNHGGYDESNGYFARVGYDPATGEVTKLPEEWLDNFEVMEIINGHSAYNWESEREIWMSLVNQGRKVTITGVSDCHTRFWPGYGRTYFWSPSATVEEAGKVDFLDAVAGGHTAVSGGLFVEIEADGGAAMAGDTVVADASGTVVLHLRVQAPRWMGPIDTLRLYENGVVAYEADVALLCEQHPDDPVRYDCDVPVHPTADAWYAVDAEGTQPMDPVVDGAIPYGLTGALYVDVDGDGWTPPGL